MVTCDGIDAERRSHSADKRVVLVTAVPTLEHPGQLDDELCDPSPRPANGPTGHD